MSTSAGLTLEKRRETGLIYHRGWRVRLVLDGERVALVIVVDVGVQVAGELEIEIEIREDVRFTAGGGARVEERFAGWSDFCNLLSAGSRNFISITSASMMSYPSSGSTSCPLG